VSVGRVAVLGAGILGTSLALMLARRGVAVTVYDRRAAPVAAASRWNEGKIHLGYLYGGDPSLSTARRVLPGGLAFGALLAELIDSDLAGHVTDADDLYLVHRESVVDAATLAATFAGVDALVRAHADAGRYLADVSGARSRQLTAAELAAIADPREIVAGLVAPERSVDTRWIADRLAAALAAEPRVTLRLGVTVTGAVPVEGVDGAWRVSATDGPDERFDLVLNALWEGRLAVDLTAGLPPEGVWSHRYRLCLFARTAAPVAAPSAVVALGPFGDVKNYNGRDFYLSWYPAGLVAEGEAVTLAEPAAMTAAERTAFVEAVRQRLVGLMPPVAAIFAGAEAIEVGGGFVFAQGRGSIGDPASTLHRRDRFGVRRRGRYVSIDTGKYSTAPWLAARLVAEICG
jgi:glycine/D-amino acid oxidase-like deaminating enzyme